MIGVSDDCMDAGGRVTQEQLPSAANTPTSSKALGITFKLDHTYKVIQGLVSDCFITSAKMPITTKSGFG
ncbi:hypothetical protein ACH42_02710 [Endozoicomonas sp. (ex Bugula neritina AB1)]|nr:hypothetical protein ACH42_02710 [Endozoicomonas sp. (ex Bugula neritina AB1)]